MIQPPIVVFIHPACFTCFEQIYWMHDQGLDFQTKDVSEPRYYEEFQKQLGSSFPFTIIQDDQEGLVRLHGYDQAKVRQVLMDHEISRMSNTHSEVNES
ncbi:hypothetical protein [Marinococcus halotolerans]|uniref:hypothetical protein n=1 Tax=Marinococcus halotolerans TaxID=301092 RepID=UPI0003B6FE47|nr:hypothetical protein [Marinococcus halotolerans]